MAEIGIRADANKIIASGHVMRCLTIARQIVALGQQVTFFVADEESEGLLKDFAADMPELVIVVLHSDWKDLDRELPVMTKELRNREIETLLVDSYKVTADYFRELSKVCRLAYMDDLGKEPYPVDMLINYSGYYEKVGYEELYEGVLTESGNPVRMYLGLKYAPLREQFYMESGSHEAGAERGGILLTAGGADMHGMLLGVLEEFDRSKVLADKISVHVVIGSLVKNAGEIRSFAKKHEGIAVHERVTDMAELMRRCDIAVAAAGTMLTECAAIGLPAIYYQVADNQKFNVEFWQKTGGMIFAGDVSSGRQEDKDAILHSIVDSIRQIREDADRLPSMKGALKGVTDGRGAVRIAQLLADPGR